MTGRADPLLTDKESARPTTALRDLDTDLELLGATLDEVCHASGAAEILSLRTRAVELARGARGGNATAGDELEQLIAGLDAEEIELLIRSLTRLFQLINLAEDNERVRRIRAREAREWPAPRRGSIDEAVSQMAQRGVGPEAMRALLSQSEIRLVMTAHPTEARRRTTIDKLARIFHELRALDDRLGRDVEQAHERIRATVQELWGSDELRAISPTVLDEVRGGLVHFASTLVDVIPRTYRELDRALRDAFPDASIEVPPLLRFGSWIGGDRDGNPNVAPDTTVQTLALLREQCLRFLEGRLETIAGRLSFSERITGPGPALASLLTFGEDNFPEMARRLEELNSEEPYRRAMTFIRERVRCTATAAGSAAAAGGYSEPSELLADLRLVERALIEDGGEFSAAGDLRDLICQVEVFGFHFATLDIRQHVQVHRAALDEVFETLGVASGYARMSESQRMALLESCIADRRPLIPADTSRFGEATREAIETFRMVQRALDGPHRGAIDAYVISGTDGAVGRARGAAADEGGEPCASRG